jgi:hypothetical protein
MGYPPIRRSLPHPGATTDSAGSSPAGTTRNEEVRVATDTLTASEVDLDRPAVDTVRVLAMDAI